MKFDALDRSLLASAQAEKANPISTVDAMAFVTGLHKMADDAAAQPAPDTTGAVEGPFLAPLPDVVSLIAQMVSNEFKTQAYYVYYANMLRGLEHEGIAEEFMEHAAHELEHANYLLRRMGVLSPGGVSIPPYPPPEPLSDPTEIVQAMIVVEQMGLSLWKQLLAVMGENPMRYTVEEFLQREEEHQDELWQLVPAEALPPMPTGQEQAPAAAAEQPAPTQQPEGGSTKVQVETAPPKMAALSRIMLAAATRKAASDANFKKKEATLITEKVMALRLEADAIARKEQTRVEANPVTPESLNTTAPFVVKTTDNTAKPKDTSKPVAGAMNLVDALDKAIKSAGGNPDISPEQYIMQEEQLGAQQAMAEAAHAKTVAMQASQAAQQSAAEAQAAQQQLQETQAQLEQANQMASQSSTQAMQATQQAAEAEGRAADHSIAKMQLGMNINQMRQELANLVMRDPVAESAANVSDLAAQGAPATPQQQAEADAAAQQQALTGEAPQPSAETQDEQGEAARAQDDASKQQEQADQSAQKDQAKGEGGKPGTHVTVKTSGMMGGVGREIGEHMAEGAVNHVRDRAAKAVGEHGGKIVAGTALGGALLAMKGHGDRMQRRSDMADSVAEGVRRAKMASPADRRMAREVMEGSKDELGNALRSILHKGMPGEAAQAAVGAKVKDVAREAKDDLPGLIDKMKPHAPAFLGGLGVGALGARATSGSRTPAASTNFNDQYYER